MRDLLTAQTANSGPVSRGIDAADEVIELIDRTLAAPLFRDVGRLRSLPTGNQVLQKQVGYRELLRTFVLTEIGARLALNWELEDAFAASQRNVATLYEYWAFIQLAKIVGRVCGEDLSARALEQSNDGLSMSFRQGSRTALKWTTTARGRNLKAELYFNRTFLVSTLSDASWTRAMRPDCSLRIGSADTGANSRDDALPIWLHFDAKYRVEFERHQFATPDDDDGELAAEAEFVERLARSKREDLLKMHAYRDAIRRSAGAYILYPGNEERRPFLEHHEILPGLGAFPLRPTVAGTAGAPNLENFLMQVLDHVADRATQHERSRYWRAVIHRKPPEDRPRDRRLPPLSTPPADAAVMCAYLEDAAHRDWVGRHGLFAVPAADHRGAVGPEAEVLRARDLVLWGPGSRPTLWTRAGVWFVQAQVEMLELGYPVATAKVYLCCPVERSEDEPEWLSQLDSSVLEASSRAPFQVTWQELLEASS